MTDDSVALSVRDLKVSYPTAGEPLLAVKGVSFNIARGRIFGLVGESGSGKSTVALAALGGLTGRASVTGSVIYRGQDLVVAPTHQLSKLWGRHLALVFQNAGATLNPVLRVGDQLVAVLRRHEARSRISAIARMLELFEIVQLPDPAGMAMRYPHQLSGGQLQRVGIAIALACDPEILVMDEPTTGLDVTNEANILDLVESLRTRIGSAILYITHNLGVVSRLCDEVAVMYAGEIVERGRADDVFVTPRHPYTRALLDCLPRVDAPPQSRRLPAIEGALPDLREISPGCQFAPRCRLVRDNCWHQRPELAYGDAEHVARCFFWQEAASIAPEQGAKDNKPQKAAELRPTLLDVRGVHYAYDRPSFVQKLLGRKTFARALDDVSLDVQSSEIVAIVGESGSGKTTLARCIVGLLQPDNGEIAVQDQRLPPSWRGWSRDLRRKLQMVFQNPDLTLNPRHTVFATIARPLALFGTAHRKSGRTAVTERLKAVRLRERYLESLPEELSGGERQRVSIARAFAAGPQLIVADEPTSALDVSVQAAILNLLVDLQERENVSYLLITHDLSVVRHLTDRTYVIYLGSVVESGRTEDVFTPPFHPYTEALLSAVPRVGVRTKQGRARLKGAVPRPGAPPTGCKLHPRCHRKIGTICEQQVPPLVVDERGHALACHIPIAELSRLQRDDWRVPGE